MPVSFRHDILDETRPDQYSNMDATRPCVRPSQVIHIHTSTVDGCGHAESRQDAKTMGL